MARAAPRARGSSQVERETRTAASIAGSLDTHCHGTTRGHPARTGVYRKERNSRTVRSRSPARTGVYPTARWSSMQLTTNHVALRGHPARTGIWKRARRATPNRTTESPTHAESNRNVNRNETQRPVKRCGINQRSAHVQCPNQDTPVDNATSRPAKQAEKSGGRYSSRKGSNLPDKRLIGATEAAAGVGARACD